MIGEKTPQPQLTLFADAMSYKNRGRVPKYVTPSRYWGPTTRRPLCTTKAKLQEHMTSIIRDKLSQTFQDMFEFCVQLDIRYVWIDSLCIIQDDSQDGDSHTRWVACTKILTSPSLPPRPRTLVVACS